MDRSYLYANPSGYQQLASADGKYLHWVTDIKDELPIFMGSSDQAAYPPKSFPEVFEEAVKTHGDRIALRYKVNNAWVTWTYKEYYRDAKAFASSLIALGCEPKSTINIIGFNAPQWVIGFAGAVLAGCIPIGVYTTNGVEACQYIASHSEASLILVQNTNQLKKYLKVKETCPKIKAIVVYWPDKELQEYSAPFIYPWDNFMKNHKEEHLSSTLRRMKEIKPTQCITIVYTSGTTGPPKGVLLSNDNCIWTSKTMIYSSELLTDDERLVSYLPLSHVAGLQSDIIGALVSKAAVTFADENALQGTLGNTLKETRPTLFFGVPRIFEKIEEKIRAIGASRTGFQKSIADWAKRVGFENTLNQLSGKPTSFTFSIAKKAIFNKIREGLGLDQCKMILVGAAPISKACLDYFLSLNIPIMNVYGMSESTAPTSSNSNKICSIYSAGFPVPGTEMVIKGPNNEVLPRGTQGEICFRGRNKFMGYYKNEQATKETIDSEGYIHSGDKGYMDEAGFLFITGRFKELIITAGGENIPPVLIEDAVKEKCKIVSNAFLVGDNRKYLVMLISLKTTGRPDGEPTGDLAPEVVEALSAAGIQVKTVAEAVASKDVFKYVNAAIEEVNKNSTSRAQEIKKFTFLPNDFSIPGGEMTPTLKVKRKFVLDKYKAVIEGLYADPKI